LFNEKWRRNEIQECCVQGLKLVWIPFLSNHILLPIICWPLRCSGKAEIVENGAVKFALSASSTNEKLLSVTAAKSIEDVTWRTAPSFAVQGDVDGMVQGFEVDSRAAVVPAT
jgi:hypothetical protein